MVQMKGPNFLVCHASHICFISHMVQMKADIEAIFEAVDTSFISHMVQMKVIFYVVYMQNLIMLYIPHGSDER